MEWYLFSELKNTSVVTASKFRRLLTTLAAVIGCVVAHAQAWVNVGTPGFSTGQVYSTSIAIDDSGKPYVAYADGTNAYKVTVMEYNGSP